MTCTSDTEVIMNLTDRLHQELNHAEFIISSGTVSLFNRAISYLRHVYNVQQRQENKQLMDELKLKYLLYLIKQDTEETMVRSYIEDFFPLLPTGRPLFRRFTEHLLKYPVHKDEFYSDLYDRAFCDSFIESLKRKFQSEVAEMRREITMNENKVIPDSDVSLPDNNLRDKRPKRRASLFANFKMKSYFTPNVSVRETTHTEIELPPLMSPTSSKTAKYLAELTTSTCLNNGNLSLSEGAIEGASKENVNNTTTEYSPVDKLLQPGHFYSIRNSTQTRFPLKPINPDSQLPRKQTKHNHNPYSDSAVLQPSLIANTNTARPVYSTLKLSNNRRVKCSTCGEKTTPYISHTNLNNNNVKTWVMSAAAEDKKAVTDTADITAEDKKAVTDTAEDKKAVTDSAEDKKAVTDTADSTAKPVPRMKLSNYKRYTCLTGQAETTVCKNQVPTENTMISDSPDVTRTNVNNTNIDAWVLATVDNKANADATVDETNNTDMDCNGNICVNVTSKNENGVTMDANSGDAFEDQGHQVSKSEPSMFMNYDEITDQDDNNNNDTVSKEDNDLSVKVYELDSIPFRIGHAQLEDPSLDLDVIAPSVASTSTDCTDLEMFEKDARFSDCCNIKTVPDLSVFLQ